MLRRKLRFSPSGQIPSSALRALTLLLILGLLTAIPIMTAGGLAKAQGASWTAWLYNHSSGSLLQVNASGGAINEVTLPLSQGFNGYGRPVVISPGGRYIAYTAFDSTQQTPSTQLFVYDQVIGTFRFTWDITGSQATGLDYAVAPLAFDEGAGRFAFGYLNESGSWQVVVGDFATASPVTILDASSPGAPDQGGSMVPVVQRLEGTTVTFTAVANGGSVQSEYPAYRWNFVDGSVNSDARYTSLRVDTDPATGQVAVAHFDAGQPHPSDQAPLNVLDIITAGGERTRLYSEGDGTIHQVCFIENGARILVEVQTASDGQTHLRVLNRDGSVAGEIVGSLNDLTGTPDGFIGTFDSGGATAIAYVNTTAAALEPVTLWSGASGVPYTLLQVMPG